MAHLVEFAWRISPSNAYPGLSTPRDLSVHATLEASQPVPGIIRLQLVQLIGQVPEMERRNAAPCFLGPFWERVRFQATPSAGIQLRFPPIVQAHPPSTNTGVSYTYKGETTCGVAMPLQYPGGIGITPHFSQTSGRDVGCTFTNWLDGRTEMGASVQSARFDQWVTQWGGVPPKQYDPLHVDIKHWRTLPYEGTGVATHMMEGPRPTWDWYLNAGASSCTFDIELGGVAAMLAKAPKSLLDWRLLHPYHLVQIPLRSLRPEPVTISLPPPP